MKIIIDVLHYHQIINYMGGPKNIGESLKGKRRKLGDVPSMVRSGTCRKPCGGFDTDYVGDVVLMELFIG